MATPSAAANAAAISAAPFISEIGVRDRRIFHLDRVQAKPRRHCRHGIVADISETPLHRQRDIQQARPVCTDCRDEFCHGRLREAGHARVGTKTIRRAMIGSPKDAGGTVSAA
jgi:hypothetical protein